ncbi:MAG: hypothetical protein AB7E47_01555 [Desulfovibrionaceae bacterium]
MSAPTTSLSGRTPSPDARLTRRTAFLVLFGALAALALGYLHRYPNPVDWDGMERFNSAIILHDVLRDALAGKFATLHDIVDRLLFYKDTVRSGAGLAIWPPLQTALLTGFVTMCGTGYATVFLFSFAMLAALAWTTVSVLHRMERLTPYSLLLMGAFFSNPIFLHHIFTLNLRYGEILALALCADIVARHAQAPRRAHLYAYAAVSVLAVFYRLTAVVVVAPAFFALFATTPRKRDWLGPLACIGTGIAAFFGLHLAEQRLIGMSFLARMGESGNGSANTPGFYTFYDFSTYYKGLASDALHTLCRNRYDLGTPQKCVYAASAFLCSGLVLFLPRTLQRMNRALFWSLTGAVGLSLALFSLHGSKPDYLLPMLFGGFLLVAGLTARPWRILAAAALCALFAWNLHATFTRSIHPYYEDINMTLFAEQKEALAGVATMHVAYTPMKHVSHWALTHPPLAVKEFYTPGEVRDVLRAMGPADLVILNNGLDYRREGLNVASLGILPLGPGYAAFPIRSEGSDYLLVRRAPPGRE